jgi:hypothetical protein
MYVYRHAHTHTHTHTYIYIYIYICNIPLVNSVWAFPTSVTATSVKYLGVIFDKKMT